ncbi:hypothetical protein [Pedobacter aquatilis]|uniref:hypothetical protein n=1 Tax=Pedobacter aquatilis TaxID=351343 RepID=UPI00292DB0FB|nr:hypothetical protein [Pedobacter aquatilis]
METDIIIPIIDELHKKVNAALENKNVNAYTSIYDETLSYTGADGVKIDKREFVANAESYFKRIKRIETSHYRIKSSLENDVFTEKIARKSVIIKPRLLVFSKKQTIQTEEVFHWKNINNEWKVFAMEIVLEEKY